MPLLSDAAEFLLFYGLPLLIGYVSGSIPFAWLVARAKGVNLFKVGSGSSGATNAARAIGWKWFFPIFALDLAKGLLPVIILAYERKFDIHFGLWAGIGAVLGHTFSPWLKFRGGKAAATGVGVVIGLAPVTGAIALGTFLVTFILTRMVSLGSILGSISIPLSYMLLSPDVPAFGRIFIMFIVLSTFVVWKHRTNIERILKGTERRAVKKKLPAGDAMPAGDATPAEEELPAEDAKPAENAPAKANPQES